MDFDQLLKESVELSKQKKGGRKKPKQQPSKQPFNIKGKEKPTPATNPPTSQWTTVATVVITTITHCKNCRQVHEAPEPHLFIKKMRTRKLGIPDVHFQQTTAAAVMNCYNYLPRIKEERIFDITFCQHCFVTSDRSENPMQLSLDEDISDTVLTLLKDLLEGS